MSNAAGQRIAPSEIIRAIGIVLLCLSVGLSGWAVAEAGWSPLVIVVAALVVAAFWISPALGVRAPGNNKKGEMK